MTESSKPKPSFSIWVAIGVLVLVIGLVVYLYEPSYEWHLHNYDDTTEQPYDADIFAGYLDRLGEERMLRVDSAIHLNLASLDSSWHDANYVVMGHLPYLVEEDVDAMLSFAERGNQIFLFCSSIPTVLMSHLHNSECLLYESEPEFDIGPLFGDGAEPLSIEDTVIYANLLEEEKAFDEEIAYEHRVKTELENYSWRYLDEAYLCEENQSLLPLGTINDKVNFIKARYGQGAIYLHSTPKLLANYYLLRPQGQAYAERVASYLGEGAIVWDTKQWNQGFDESYYQNNYAQFDGPLSYLLSQESLRWSVYCILIGTALFLLLGGRRRQRPIPVLLKKENSSMQYVDTMTDLYFARQGDARIFRYLSEQFQFHVRKRYRVHLDSDSEEAWQLLAKASGLEQAHLDKIRLKQKQGAFEGNVDQAALAEYYKLLDHFYMYSK